LFLSNEQYLPLSGGGSIGNVRIVENLVRRGHDVTVATPLYLGEEEKRSIERKHNIKLRPFSPFYIHKNITFRGPKYVLYSLLFTFHLARLILSGRYDVIFVRNCLLGFPAALLRPFNRSMHVLSMTDFLTGFLYNNKTYPRLAVNHLYYIERLIPQFFDMVFVITPEMKRRLISGGCQPSKITVSYDGVDTRIFNPERPTAGEIGEMRYRYGMEARMAFFHGTIDDHAKTKLKEIIKVVTAKNRDIVFLLLGQGKKYDELKGELESSNVFFPGYVGHEDIPKYIAAANVGIIPYENNFNSDMILTLKLLEYLSMGLPVVSTDLKSIREIFGGYDFIRLSGTTQEFAENIIALAERPKSQEAVELMRGRYSWDMITTDMIEAVEKKSAGRRG